MPSFSLKLPCALSDSSLALDLKSLNVLSIYFASNRVYWSIFFSVFYKSLVGACLRLN